MFISILALYVIFGGSCEAVTVLDVSDFGAKADDGVDDGAAFREALIEAGKAEGGVEIRIGRGEWRIGALKDGEPCLNLEGMKDVTVRGNGEGTLLIATSPESSLFRVGGCEKVTLRDFVIDYDPLPFTQGRVTAVDEGKFTFDLEIEDGFDGLDEKWFVEANAEACKWGAIVDANEPHLKAGVMDHVFIEGWERVEGRTWRMRPREDYRGAVDEIEVGDRFVQLARTIGGATIYLSESKDCRIENVVAYSGSSCNIAVVGNDGVVIENFQVRRKPGSGRLISSDADGVHCQQNRGGLVIQKCYFEGMADDAVNIYAPPNIVTEVVSEREVVATAGCNLRVGDVMQVMSPVDGKIRGEVAIEKLEQEGGVYRITFAEAVAGMKAGRGKGDADTLYNLSSCGAGYVIRDNYMADYRRHGILLRAGDGVVENNVIQDVSGQGIVLMNEPSWPEGPMPWNVTIRGNKIRRVAYSSGYNEKAAIEVKSAKFPYGSADYRGVHGIRILDNEIVDAPGTAIGVISARDVEIAGNAIIYGEGSLLRESCAIVVENSEGVVIGKTLVTDETGKLRAVVEIDEKSEGIDVGEIESEVEKVIDKRKGSN